MSGINVFERTVPTVPDLADRCIRLASDASTERSRTFPSEVSPGWILKPFLPLALRALVESRLHS